MEKQRPNRRDTVIYPEKCNTCDPSSKEIPSIMGCEEFARGVIPKKCDKALQRSGGWSGNLVDGKKGNNTSDSPGHAGKIRHRISGYSKMK